MSFTAEVKLNNKVYIVSESSTNEAGARCGLKFNPNEDDRVAEIKGFHAAAMQSVIKQKNQALARMNDKDGISDGDADALRCFTTALKHLETAQMFAVKGLFTNRNRGEE